METKVKLLELLKPKEILGREFQKNYSGSGLLRKFKGLLKYRGKYLRYCSSKFKKPCLVKTKTFWGDDFLMFISKGSEVFYFGILSGRQEINLIKFLIKNLKDDSIFYDIGANFGYYTLLVRAINKDIEVHAFEPTPKIFEYLGKNLSKTKTIFKNQLALFNKDGQMDFYDATEASRSGVNTLDISMLLNRENKSFFSKLNKIKVQSITIDKYCINHLKPTFLKIDVEGAEGEVIEGGIKILKEGNPIIAIEIWRENNKSHLKAMEILYNLGYKSYKIDDKGELEFIEKIEPEKDISVKDIYDNFLFKK